ncbi:NHL repeat-containing protein [Dyadobacter arcticus]|uniref:DNA-binding beta-propeller fold protein YncE n=1 Tax=Dyadobacter arcticus TaxID=1078754 RepID=A0ABX0USW7_9BACT|nr:NHL repeat-containing protein [Dyadobacter arcticus]NIJ55513.1 DNA-binding beta-propeller fold protein YncE [Dyadobacter arcticus]
MRTLFVSALLLTAGLSIQSCVEKEELAPPVVAVVKDYTVSTLAGNGTYGFADGAGKDAAFRSAFGLTSDAAGNIYVADGGNNRVRKITPAGIVTTVAGDGTIGSRNGPGENAQFNYPHGLVVDKAGNIYVADAGNNMIRKITPDGVVSTFAGSGVEGLKNGIGAAAAFSFPADIILDPQGNFYISDGSNRCIRKITPDGFVSTFATGFGFPEGLEMDKAGNIYVADAGGFVIRKITPEGTVSIFAGSESEIWYVDGKGAVARFHNPEGIAIDNDGNLYVGDLNAAIRKITPDGIVSTIAGNGTKGFVDGPAMDARFHEPSGVAIDPAGNIYVADVLNSRIRKIKH